MRSLAMSILLLGLVHLLTSGCGREGGGRSAPTFERRIPLEGQANFRDAGGWATADGGRVRTGVFYRSGELCHLTGEDVARLGGLGLKTSLDFRSAEEVASRGADRLPPGAAVFHHPVQSGDLGPLLRRSFAEADDSELPVGILAEANRQLVHGATEPYAALFRALADTSRLPLVVHCTHGKDRSGIATALVLLTLGVPVETVKADYLLSNEYRREANAAVLDDLRRRKAGREGVDPATVDMAAFESLLVLDGAYFDAALDEIDMAYGSLDGYLRDGLGLEPGVVDRLRANLLE